MEVKTDRSYSLHPNAMEAVERDDDDLGYLWFAEKSPDQVRYVGITRSFETDELHVERDDQRWSAYGGITEVSYDGRFLRCCLDAEGANKLGGFAEILVDCRHFREAQRRQAAKALQAVFADTDVAVSIDMPGQE